MTGRPVADERDPLPPREWVEASSPGIRRMALEAAAAAVRASKEKDKKPAGETA